MYRTPTSRADLFKLLGQKQGAIFPGVLLDYGWVRHRCAAFTQNTNECSKPAGYGIYVIDRGCLRSTCIAQDAGGITQIAGQGKNRTPDSQVFVELRWNLPIEFRSLEQQQRVGRGLFDQGVTIGNGRVQENHVSEPEALYLSRKFLYRSARAEDDTQAIRADESGILELRKCGQKRNGVAAPRIQQTAVDQYQRAPGLSRR